MGNSAQNGRGGQQADGTDSVGVTDNRVADAVAELYGADPQAFTERRKALGDAARAAGDTAAARQIAALRKPTRAAWVVNRLARDDEGAPARLASLAADLRAAEQARDGPRLRELSAARGPLIDGLTAQALAGASVADPPAGLRDEVAATLTAALADPEVAAAFEAGTLTRAAQWAGFGLALPSTAPDTGADTEFAAAPGSDTAFGEEPAPGERPRSTSLRGREPQSAPRATPLRPARPRRGSRTGAARQAEAAPPTPLEEGRRLREGRRERERLAREESARQQRLAEQERKRQQQAAEEAAQAAARRRKIFEDAERGVASAIATAEDAVAAEDRLEEEVRNLEQRLTSARAELADARMRARRAENAERKARQTLDRLPRPDDRP